MSFHSKDYGLNPTQKFFDSWVGDGALTFVTRLVLVEKYPFIPIKLLMARERRINENYALTAYCKRNNLPFGCNHLETKFNQLVCENKIQEAKDIVLDIIKYDKCIHHMDCSEILDGKLRETVKEALINKYQSREQKKIEHDNINLLNLPHQTKKQLHIQLKNQP